MAKMYFVFVQFSVAIYYVQSSLSRDSCIEFDNISENLEGFHFSIKPQACLLIHQLLSPCFTEVH